ncbi:MAG: M36 family metallopeptidase [Gemmatimonadaceae bacterium]|nr:M36 family metallopeptidase [Gemmatimonadaceae bacterium]
MRTLEKRIDRLNIDEERDRLEASERFRVTGIRSIRGVPDECLMRYVARRAPRPRPVLALRGVRGVKGLVEMSRSRAVARRVFDLTTPPSSGTPRAIATAFITRLAHVLGIHPQLAGLKYERTKTTILGSHVLFQQYVGLTQISGAWLRVDIAPDGRVFNVQNDTTPHQVMQARVTAMPLTAARATRSRLPGDEGAVLSHARVTALARAAVRREPGARTTVTEPELTYRIVTGTPQLAWKVVVDVSRPRQQWKLYLDAFTGAVLWKRSVLKHRARAGRVFDPNPVAALDDITLRAARRVLPDAAYRTVTLPDVSRSGLLDGPFVTTRPTPRRVRRRRGSFDFRRGERGFGEVMVYYHIDRLQRHLQSLGFTGLLDFPFPVNVTASREDNSYYDPDARSVALGTGGVDDAEDAETVIHEYGHALQDAQIPGFGESVEAGAMGEGFGDFLAASTYADRKSARLRATLSGWDCIECEPQGGVPCLRRLDSRKRFPRDFVGEVHDDGEIWSACLWQLRIALGREAAERLVVAHHYLLNRWASFEDAAHALLTTDRQLCAGRNAVLIRGIFGVRGVLRR